MGAVEGLSKFEQKGKWCSKYLGTLKSLQFLYIGQNELRSAPDLSGLTSLQHLDLHNNQLTTPPNLSGLKSLQQLDLRNNKLTKAPDVARLPQLRVYLDYNSLLSVS
eukprot:g34486.t1